MLNHLHFGAVKGDDMKYVLVPVEPTEAILEKLRSVLPELFDTSDDTLREIYIDILATSPASPAPVDGELVERVAMDEIKLTGLKDVVAWLECQPQWSGVAVRRVDDPPIPGEPFISMESAKLLIVSAVSIMDNRSFEAAARIEALDEALKPFGDRYDLFKKTYPHDSEEGREIMVKVSDLRRAARAYANKGEQT